MPSDLSCAIQAFARSSDISGWLSSSKGMPRNLSPRTDLLCGREGDPDRMGYTGKAGKGRINEVGRGIGSHCTSSCS